MIYKHLSHYHGHVLVSFVSSLYANLNGFFFSLKKQQNFCPYIMYLCNIELKYILQLLSEMNPKKIHTKDSAGMTSLHCAVACSSVSTVDYFKNITCHIQLFGKNLI